MDGFGQSHPLRQQKTRFMRVFCWFSKRSWISATPVGTVLIFDDAGDDIEACPGCDFGCRMGPRNASLDGRIYTGIAVVATTGVKVGPSNAGSRQHVVVFIYYDDFPFELDRVVAGLTIAPSAARKQFIATQKDPFDFLVAETGAGCILVLGPRHQAN